MRYLDPREILELTATTGLGFGAAWLVREYRPLWVARINTETLFWLGAGAGLLLGIIWSAWRVERRIDRSIPSHLRTPPSPRDGRPIGVLAWRTRDAASEYLWFLLGTLVALMIVWLWRTFIR